MDGAKLQSLTKYGAVLSLLGTAAAIIAYGINGPNSIVALFFGWAGPLGVFCFGGMYLAYSTSYTVIGEELLRGCAWYFLSLIAWSVIITETNALSATAFTVFGLPALTTLGIALVMVATRYLTDRDLQVQTEGGQLLVMVTGGIAFGFLALYLSLSETADWWLFGLYLLSLPAGLVLYRVMKKRYPKAYGVN